MYATLLREAILALAIALITAGCSTTDYRHPVNDFASATSDAETALVEHNQQVTGAYRETLADSIVNGKVSPRQKDTRCSSSLPSFVLLPTCQTLQLETPKHGSLQWDSKITTFPIFNLPIASALTVELDLQIFDRLGNQVGYSGSWDNSYEIAEFEGKPGETYTIKTRPWSGSDDVWYGLAWTVSGGLLWADVTNSTVLQELIARR